MVDFGLRVKKLRTERNLTQEQLATRLSLTKSVVSAYETDVRMPSYDTLIQLSRIFSVSTDYLLGVKEERNVDVTDLSDENIALVSNLVSALKDKN